MGGDGAVQLEMLFQHCGSPCLAKSGLNHRGVATRYKAYRKRMATEPHESHKTVASKRPRLPSHMALEARESLPTESCLCVATSELHLATAAGRFTKLTGRRTIGKAS